MYAKEKKNKSVQFELSRNEALVFFEWLSRFTSKERQEYFIHNSEEQILFDFEACLEKILVEPFENDYSRLLQAAQENIFPTDST